MTLTVAPLLWGLALSLVTVHPAVPAPSGDTTVVRLYVISVKVAVTDLSLSIMIVVVAEELVMLPDQPENIQPVAGLAVTLTVEPMMCGLSLSLVTVPFPMTVVVRLKAARVKVALTDLSPFIRIVVGLVEPDRLPDQPENVHPWSGIAVIRTTDPMACELEVLVVTVPFPALTEVVRL